MADEKGNIVLKPILEVKQAIKSVKELASSISDMFKKSSDNKENQFKELQEQVENSKVKLKSLSDELKNTEKELRKTEVRATKAQDEFTELVQRGTGIKELREQLAQIPEQLKRFEKRKEDIASGKVSISEDFRKLDEALKDANDELEEFIKKRDQAEAARVIAESKLAEIKTVPAKSAGSRKGLDEKYYKAGEVDKANSLRRDIQYLTEDFVNANSAINIVKNNIEELSTKRQKIAADPKLSTEYIHAKDNVNDLKSKEQELIKEIEKRKAAYDSAHRILGSTAIMLGSSVELLREKEAALRGEIVGTKTEIESTKNKIRDLKKEINNEGAGGKSGRGLFGKMFNSLRQLDHMFKRMTTRLLFYNTFGKTIRAFTEYLGRAVQADSNLVYSLGALKAAFATTFQYIWSVIGPIISKIIAIILNLVNAINRLLSLITGKSLKDMQNGAKALDGYGKAAKGATKEIKKTLAAFDELIQIGDKDEDAGSGGSGEGIPLNWDDSLLKGKLSELDIYVAGAMLAVGAILTFTGANVPLGLGLMAAGAAVLASALMEDWDTMPREIKRALTNVLVVLGTGALVIGAILAFTGANIPLGIGLMIAGAAALGTAIALNWNTLEQKLRGPLGDIVFLVSTALVAIGAVLAFSGANVGLGLALIIAGFAGMFSMIGLNWDIINQKLQGPLGVIMTLILSALLVIGVILVFSGAHMVLGFGLIVASVAGLAKIVSVNWDTIKQKLQGPFGEIMALIGTFLIVLGIILVMSGAGIPLGLGILAIGALSLATPIAANWDIIKEKVKGAWESIKQYWEQHIKPIFTIKWWKDKFWTIVDAIKEALNSAIATVETALNTIGEAISEVLSFDVPSIVPGIGGKHFGITIPKANLPRLAQGSVIPPNKEFMAVLGDQKHGTNIEAPLDTMVAAFNEALANNDSGRNINIRFDGNLAQLARILKPYIDDETTRQGRKSNNGLIVGGY